MILAVDYDCTIVDGCFPAAGVPKEGAVAVLRALVARGDKLILWTCREDHPKHIGKRYLTDAVNVCARHGIELHSVNETRIEDEFRDAVGRKVYADMYIDDRNFGGFPGWCEIAKELLGWGPLTYIKACYAVERENVIEVSPEMAREMGL